LQHEYIYYMQSLVNDLIHTSEITFAQVQCSPRYNGNRQTDISLDWSL